MSNALRKRPKIRRVCRKCGCRLQNKEEYGVVCPRCGWMKTAWTDNVKPLKIPADYGADGERR